METDQNQSLRTVAEFWRLMASNNFEAVKEVLSEEFILEWPQSNERIRGPINFVQMNAEFPANGPWRFTVNRIVANGTEAVSDVSVSDGVKQARAISFFEVAEGRIRKILEFWPDPFEPPMNRQHLVELLSPITDPRNSL